MKGFRTTCLAVIAAVALSSCGGPGRIFGDGPKKTGSPDTATALVAAALYPLAEMVDAVGGTHVKVMNLTPPGSDAHGVELTAQQLESLGEAKITFYLGENYQPTVQKSIESMKTRAVDLLDSLDLYTMSSDGHADDHDDEEHGSATSGNSKDPHVWLDPAYMINMTRVIADNLSQLFPQLSDEFADNAAKYIDSLEIVGNEIDQRFKSCSSRTLVTAHYSFGYFARRAQLEVHSVAEINPDEQLSAKKLEELAALVKAENVSTIFYEEMVSTDLARTLADKAGVKTDTLNPLEGMSQKDIDAGKTYVSVQRDNINKIAASLSCS